jgi:hypothetical protein
MNWTLLLPGTTGEDFVRYSSTSGDPDLSETMGLTHACGQTNAEYEIHTNPKMKTIMSGIICLSIIATYFWDFIPLWLAVVLSPFCVYIIYRGVSRSKLLKSQRELEILKGCRRKIGFCDTGRERLS